MTNTRKRKLSIPKYVAFNAEEDTVHIFEKIMHRKYSTVADRVNLESFIEGIVTAENLRQASHQATVAKIKVINEEIGLL